MALLATVLLALAMWEIARTRGAARRWLDHAVIAMCAAILAVGEAPEAQLVVALAVFGVCMVRRNFVRRAPRVPACAIVRTRWRSFRS